jgi:lipid-A-disaccharide synthase
MSDVFVFAGEASGDSHGAHLIREIKKLAPHLSIEGVGGPKMRTQGIKTLIKMEAFQVMGFSDVIRHLPCLYQNFYLVLNHLLKTSPSACVLIDYPGFNLRLAKALKKRGFKGKIIHYICPSVWAWGKGRIKTLSNYVDELFTIFPFEKALFSEEKLTVSYIGNPVVEAINHTPLEPHWRELSGLPASSKKLIALFPGSRQGEIERNLPLQLKALELLHEQLPHAHFALSITSPKLQATIASILSTSNLKIHLVPSTFNYELMREATSAIAKSGTITLELALHKLPTTVTYPLSTLNRLIAKYLIRLRLPHYCIVNILKGEEIFPELIEKRCDPCTLAEEALRLETDLDARQKVLQGCQDVIDQLGPSEASHIAAKKVLSQCGIN